MTYRIHIALNVSDVAASADFYARLLGSPPDKRSEGFAKFEPPGIAINLALIQRGETARPASGHGDINHLGLQQRSAEEVRAEAARLREAGLAPVPDVSLSGEERVLLYDPDGNEWEIFYATALRAPHEPDGSRQAGGGLKWPRQSYA